jgi:hypothetical protein
VDIENLLYVDTSAIESLQFVFLYVTSFGKRTFLMIIVDGKTREPFFYGASSVSKMLFYFKIRFSFSYNAINFG